MTPVVSFCQKINDADATVTVLKDNPTGIVSVIAIKIPSLKSLHHFDEAVPNGGGYQHPDLLLSFLE